MHIRGKVIQAGLDAGGRANVANDTFGILVGSVMTSSVIKARESTMTNEVDFVTSSCLGRCRSVLGHSTNL